MAKNKTPLLRPLREQGATLYVFPSATEDIGLNINNGTTGVALSHYALMNFNSNNTKFDFSTSQSLLNLAKSLQNYAMNFETAVLNQPNYNFQEPYTVSEHVFWRWVEHIQKNDSTKVFNETEIGTTGLYREVNYKSSDTNRLVQCFGSIDAGNSLSTDFGMFNETYVNIPTSYGNGPVFFRKVTNNPNFVAGSLIAASSKIEGRNDDVGYLGSINSEFDNNATNIYNNGTPYEIVKDVQSIQAALRTLSGDSTLSISSYDDVNIDADGILKTITESNGSVFPYDMSEKCEFKFNAILLYYSIYDLNDVYKQAIATNLFGIVFLNNTSTAPFLTPMTKKKSYNGKSNDNAYFGNSYSFRINIKTLSVYDNTDAKIDDNTTTTSAYSVDFNDVISNLNRAIDSMNTNVQTTRAIQDNYMRILTYYNEAKEKIESIEVKLNNKLSDGISDAIVQISSDIDDQITARLVELGLIDTSNLSSDMTETINEGSSQTVQTYGTVPTSYAAPKSLNLQSNSLEGELTGSRVNIISASNTNVKANNTVNITGKNIVFNVQLSNGEYVSIPLVNILEKLNMLKNSIDDFAENIEFVDDDTITYESAANIVDDMQETQENPESPETEERTVAIKSLFDTVAVPIAGLLVPYAKKPTEVGYYLKKNTAGNITNITYFDGNDYAQTDKCISGKMYIMDGLVYVFNGETCKPLGD